MRKHNPCNMTRLSYSESVPIREKETKKKYFNQKFVNLDFCKNAQLDVILVIHKLPRGFIVSHVYFCLGPSCRLFFFCWDADFFFFKRGSSVVEWVTVHVCISVIMLLLSSNHLIHKTV